jgi:hypothetical protein
MRRLVALASVTVSAGAIGVFGFAGTAAALPPAEIAVAAVQTSVVVGATVSAEATVFPVYDCPSQDQGNYPVGPDSGYQQDGTLFCSYPAVAGQDPLTYYCDYGGVAGGLTTDHDGDECPPSAPLDASSGSTPTGTVTFTLYNQSDGFLGGSPLLTDTEPLVAGVASSAPYTTTAAGTDYWVVNYSGDGTYSGGGTAFAFTPVTVTEASPTISSVAGSSLLAVGQSTADTATVSGGYNPTGSVTFNIYPNDSCTGAPLLTDADVALSGATATAPAYTPTASGSIYWVATYNGDGNNSSVTGSCSADSVTVNAEPISQTIAFSQPLGPYVIGRAPISLTASASSAFGVSYSVTGPCSVTATTLTLTGAGVCKVTASQSGGNGYGAAKQVTRSVAIGYGFKGFSAPTAKTKLEPGAKIALRFEMVNAAGQAISSSAAAALAKAHDVRVALSGPGIKKALTAVCRWSKGAFSCSIKAPKKVKTGARHAYQLSAQENIGAGFQTDLVFGSAKNPVTIHFK